MDENTKKLVLAVGALAELAHAFYKAMIQTGASNMEALTGMSAFIQAELHESMNGGKKKDKDTREAMNN